MTGGRGRPDCPTLPPRREATAGVLVGSAHRLVRNGAAEPLGSSRRSSVWRVAADRNDDPRGHVVVKQFLGRRGRPFDAGDQTPYGPAERFFNEVASLRFLTAVPGLESMTPELLGADADLGVVVMENVGNATTPAAVLLGDDRDRAEMAVLRWAQAPGRVHASTVSRLAAFDACWKAVAGRARRHRDRVELVRQDWARLVALARRLGVSPGAGFDDDLARALALVLGPGGFRVYSPSWSMRRVPGTATASRPALGQRGLDLAGVSWHWRGARESAPRRPFEQGVDHLGQPAMQT